MQCLTERRRVIIPTPPTLASVLCNGLLDRRRYLCQMRRAVRPEAIDLSERRGPHRLAPGWTGRTCRDEHVPGVRTEARWRDCGGSDALARQHEQGLRVGRPIRRDRQQRAIAAAPVP